MKTPSLSATLSTNAITSALAGLALLMAPALIGEFLGDVSPWICQLVGAGLFLFAVWVYWVRSTLPESGPWVGWILGFDVAWILATPVVMLFFSEQLNAWGHTVLAGVALWVSAFAFLEGHWLKRIKGTDSVQASRRLI